MLDLLSLPGLGRFLRWRHARTALGLPLFLAAALLVVDGLSGPQLAPKNLATVLVWVHYRGFLVLALLLAGNLFCMACPFMLPRNLARRFLRPRRAWPRRLRHKWTALALFALLLFAYELFDLWATPYWTAWLMLAYFGGALLIDGLFQGATFCKYLCPLGQFNFVASLCSPLEIKVRESVVCASCETKDCIKGRSELRGCELALFQPRKVGNLDCTFCLDCLHACPYDNVGLLTRLPAGELLADPWRSGVGRLSRRPDLAALVVLFTFGALLNAFGMVRPVYQVETWLGDRLGTHSEALVLGLIFGLGWVVLPAALLAPTAWIARRWAGLQSGLAPFITRYVYAMAPLGLGIWVAHYAFHFLSGFWTFVPVIQEVIGWGAPRWDLGPLLPADWLLPLQQAILSAGWLVSLLVLNRLAATSAPERARRAFIPWAVLTGLLWLAANWLMAQPMEMRGTVLG